MKGCENMKKLICTKEVEAAAAKGEKVIYIECNTLITPSAKDAAAEHGIEFSTEGCPCCAPAEPAPAAPAPAPAAPAAQASSQGGIDSELIFKALTAMMEKGMLGDIMALAGNDLPYVSEKSCDGAVKLVKGSTAKWEPLDTGNPADKVFYNELINADDGSSMGAGFITIENCTFPWECVCEEIYYVVEGTLNIEKDGKVFTAHAGDAMFFQNGAKLTFGSPDKMKAFYVTH